ncbi:hypothetical protein RIF29_25495 [Crotalaria pallida]|uniref:Uncharacterized protein n=1 Tax=Crotalaria pallida TaxID=3830 RepID=A0AAN9ENW0_CROPI
MLRKIMLFVPRLRQIIITVMRTLLLNRDKRLHLNLCLHFTDCLRPIHLHSYRLPRERLHERTLVTEEREREQRRL